MSRYLHEIANERKFMKQLIIALMVLGPMCASASAEMKCRASLTSSKRNFHETVELKVMAEEDGSAVDGQDSSKRFSFTGVFKADGSGELVIEDRDLKTMATADGSSPFLGVSYYVDQTSLLFHCRNSP